MTDEEFTVNYRSLHAEAMKFARQHSVGRKDPDSIATEAVAQLWLQASKGKVENPLGLLRRIVNCVCFKRHRNCFREINVDGIVDLEKAYRTTVAEQIDARLFLSSLTDTERAIVDGRAANESFQQIAEDIRMPRETVRLCFLEVRTRLIAKYGEPFSEN